MTSGGCVVNLASIAGLRGGANISAYATSKAAVIGMTHAFAAELGARGIRVNAQRDRARVIDTPGVQDQLSPRRAVGVNIDAAISANPLRTMGQPDPRGACGAVPRVRPGGLRERRGAGRRRWRHRLMTPDDGALVGWAGR
jgi:NAD(P)-dependent dehydrogenase (short-subunit alcohol dehydrogenase family)